MGISGGGFPARAMLPVTEGDDSSGLLTGCTTLLWAGDVFPCWPESGDRPIVSETCSGRASTAAVLGAGLGENGRGNTTTTCVRVEVAAGRRGELRDAIRETDSGNDSASGVAVTDTSTFWATSAGRSNARMTSSTRQTKMPDSTSRMNLLVSGAPAEGFGGFMAFVLTARVPPAIHPTPPTEGAFSKPSADSRAGCSTRSDTWRPCGAR